MTDSAAPYYQSLPLQDVMLDKYGVPLTGKWAFFHYNGDYKRLRDYVIQKNDGTYDNGKNPVQIDNIGGFGSTIYYHIPNKAVRSDRYMLVIRETQDIDSPILQTYFDLPRFYDIEPASGRFLPVTDHHYPGDHLVLDFGLNPRWTSVLQIPNISGNNYIGQVLSIGSNKRLRWSDPSSGLPSSSSASPGDYLVLDSHKTPHWQAESKQLPDEATASAGDHLILDSNKNPQWQQFSGITVSSTAKEGDVLSVDASRQADWVNPRTLPSFQQIKYMESSGVISGFNVTKNSANLQSVNISSGKGVFVDSNNNPEVLSLHGIDDYTIHNIGSGTFTYLTVDKNGTFNQYSVYNDPYLNDEILIAVIDHSEVTNEVKDIYNVGRLTYGLSAQIKELIKYISPISNVEIDNSGATGLKRTAGFYYGPGFRDVRNLRFYENDISAQDPVTFVFRQNNGITTSPLTDFPSLPNVELNPNQLSQMGAEQWAVFPVYMMSNGKIVVLYATDVVADIADLGVLKDYIIERSKVHNQETKDLGALISLIVWHGGHTFAGKGGKSYIVNISLGLSVGGGGGGNGNLIPAPKTSIDDGKVLVAYNGGYTLSTAPGSNLVTDRPSSPLLQQGGIIKQLREDTHLTRLLNQNFPIDLYRGDFWFEMFSATKDGATPNSSADTESHVRMADILPLARFETGLIDLDANIATGGGNVYNIDMLPDAGGLKIKRIKSINPNSKYFNANFEDVFPDKAYSLDARYNHTSNPIIVKMAKIPGYLTPTGKPFENSADLQLEMQLYPKLTAHTLGANSSLTITSTISTGYTYKGYYLPPMLNRNADGTQQSFTTPVGLKLTSNSEGYVANSPDGLFSNTQFKAVTHIKDGFISNDYWQRFSNINGSLGDTDKIAEVMKTNPYIPINFKLNSIVPDFVQPENLVQNAELQLHFNLPTHSINHVRFDIVYLSKMRVGTDDPDVSTGDPERGNVEPGELILVLKFIPKENSTYVKGCEFNPFNNKTTDYPALTLEHISGMNKINCTFAGVIDANTACYFCYADLDAINNSLVVMRIHGLTGTAGENLVLNNYQPRLGIVNRNKLK